MVVAPPKGRAGWQRGRRWRSPSIFTGLEEQLGVKLPPERAAVDVLVIDRGGAPDAELMGQN